MKLAIMQPYLFPYLGYYQLLNAVDRFVVYDDVQFMLQGWVNRNHLLVNGRSYLFTLPLEKVSSHRTVRATQVKNRLFPGWYAKFMRTLRQSYSRAPQVERVLELVAQTFVGARERSAAEVATESLRQVHHYLQLPGELVPTATTYQNAHLSGPARVLDICRQEGATHYVNAINGTRLYQRADFAVAGIELQFLQSAPLPYPQRQPGFVPNLSILDALMFNEPAAVRELLTQYTLV
ncbi:WbqC family protein [Hymenobacter fastidiosus]|uniref:WbqC family protein n=1 Tax=Hymenobacter fastidiosus TaxID=486264 RepID=A0ABP7SYC9_9BACT